MALAVVNIVLALAVTILWLRNLRPPKEDPRLSKGLQLLQSKIAVLEDLSDRTDRQVKQLIQILEERAKNLQAKLVKADAMMSEIDHATAKSLKVANIFQDKIPHEEIIERQNTSKYVQAAKMAHAGSSVEEICQKLNIPRSEAEFIAKVNQDELMFEPDALPEWMQEAKEDFAAEKELLETQEDVPENFDEEEGTVHELRTAPKHHHFVEQVFQQQQHDLSDMNRITNEFKHTVEQEREAQARVEAIEKRIAERQKAIADKAKSLRDEVSKTVSKTASDVGRRVSETATEVSKNVSTKAGKAINDAAEKAKPVVKKVRFPKIDPDSFF